MDADQGFLRVVAFIGRQVVAWGTAPLGRDAESDGVSEAGGDAGRLRWLLQELPFKNGRLVTALPANAPVVRHLRLPKMRRRYVTQVILSEIADTIPFDMEAVERSWVQRRTDAGHEAMAVVVPKEAVDGHVKLLREAGRAPAATYARASALASGVGVQDAVMIDLGTVSVDIVLVREGSPRVTHRVESLRRNTHRDALDEGIDGISQAVEGMVGYEDTRDGAEADLAPLPLVFVGPLARDEQLVGELKARLGREALPFATSFQYPGQFPLHEYVHNLGLAEADRVRSGASKTAPGRGWPSLNLLPERHRPRSLPWVPAGVFAFLVLIAYLAVGISDRVGAVESEEAALSSAVARLESEDRTRRLVLAGQSVIEDRISDIARGMAALKSTQARLDRRMETLVGGLVVSTVQGLPPGVGISAISVQPDGFILTGRGVSYDSVFQYLANLSASEFLEETRIIRVDLLGSIGNTSDGQQADSAAVSFQAKTLLRAEDSGSSDSTGTCQ